MINTRLATLLTVVTLVAVPGAASNGDVTFIPGARTTAAFAEGGVLLATDAYAVHASRRDVPGPAELHGRDTDIFYVLEGTATLVTGGRLVDGKDTAPNEQRGTRLADGSARKVAKGDVIVVPSGVPHQFAEVEAPFLYYTVKVAGPARK